MKEVRFVFYRAKLDWKNVIRRKRKLHLIDDGISLWTGLFNWFTPPYSRMSVWIPRENGGLFTSGTRLMPSDQWVIRYFWGTCYTSTMRGDDNGTVSRPASTVFKYPKRWEYIEFEVTDESFEEAKAWADKRVAMKWSYSKHGEGWATRLLLPLLVHQYPMLNEILIRCPRRLWRDLVRRHHVPTYSLATNKMVRDSKGKKIKA